MKAIRVGMSLFMGGILTLVMTSWLRLPAIDYSRFEARSPVISARDGTTLHVLLATDDRYRLLTSPEDVSPQYIASLINIEDQYFYQHPGVNPLALIRAASQWLIQGRIVSGGSTITMQVARLLEPRPRTLGSKWIDILRAVELSWRHSKAEILTMYLTMVPMGGNVEGLSAGSYRLWGQSPKHLSLAQIATLLAIPQSPEARDPFRKSTQLQKSRATIAERLIAGGLFPESDRDDLNTLLFDQPHRLPQLAWHVSHQMMAAKDADQTSTNTTTTLDALLQSDIERTVARFAETLPSNLNVAVIVANAPTGEVLAHVGSAGVHSTAGFLDFTRTARSPGSTLKPFIYGMAMDDGLVNDQSILFDTPVAFGRYRPTNFDGNYSGAVRMGDALKQSLNIPAVSVLNALGTKVFVDAWLHADLGLRLADSNQPGLGLALGAAATSLQDLVGAYTALANDGYVMPLRYTQQTAAQQTAAQSPRFLLSNESAKTIRAILATATNSSGRTNAPQWRRAETAFKTGTSYGFRDSWTLGTKGEQVIGVWIGNPDGAADKNNTGRNRALTLAESVADLLPSNHAETQWRSEPILASQLPKSPFSVVYPSNGSEIILDSAPNLRRKLQMKTSGDSRSVQLLLNGLHIEQSEEPEDSEIALSIPDDGFYELKVVENGHISASIEFAIFSQAQGR